MSGGSAWGGAAAAHANTALCKAKLQQPWYDSKGICIFKGKANALGIFRIFRSFESLTFTGTWRY